MRWVAALRHAIRPVSESCDNSVSACKLPRCGTPSDEMVLDEVIVRMSLALDRAACDTDASSWHCSSSGQLFAPPIVAPRQEEHVGG